MNINRLVFLFVVLFLFGCNKQESVKPEVDDSADTYNLKTYKVSRTKLLDGYNFAMDLVHNNSSADTMYVNGNKSINYDLLFCNIKVYNLDENGDTLWSDCPAIYLYTGSGNSNSSAKAYNMGAGITSFNSFTFVNPLKESELAADYAIDLGTCKDASGNFVKAKVMDAYTWLVIGNTFNTELLAIDGSNTEQEVQPVFMVKTREGLFAKFMVTYYQLSNTNEVITQLQWKVFEE